MTSESLRLIRFSLYIMHSDIVACNIFVRTITETLSVQGRQYVPWSLSGATMWPLIVTYFDLDITVTT